MFIGGFRSLVAEVGACFMSNVELYSYASWLVLAQLFFALMPPEFPIGRLKALKFSYLKVNYVVGCFICLLSMGPFFILEKLTEVDESSRLTDKINVVFDQARSKQASFAALMRDVCCSLRVSLSKKCRLAAELEALGEQGDVVRALENMKEIVVRDSVTLADLEQLLARSQIRVGLKDGYLADVEEKA
ncbi:hypothetical protein Tco_1200339 [Tanacetum coccineum]